MRGGYWKTWDDPACISVLTPEDAYRRRRKKRWARNAADNGSSLLPFDEAFSPESLLRTLRYLARKGGQAPGPDGLRYRDLSRRDEPRLARVLSTSVLTGMYRPQRTRSVPIPKPSGGTRRLSIPCAPDRVVSRQLLEVLTPVVEPIFLPSSFGFRLRRSPWHALSALEAAMRIYGAWVVTPEDIKAAFDRVRIDHVLSDFARVITDPQYLSLIAAVLRGTEGERRKLGISQGDPMSPAALNVHLHFVHDAPIGDVGTPTFWLRYADDLAYLSRTSSEGQEARERSADLLKQAGLTLKGPGEPIDLRKGGSAQLLGLVIQLHEGTIRYSIPDKAYKELENSLEGAHAAEDPPETARRGINGWLNYYGPAFERNADDVVERVLSLTARHGFRGILRSEDIRSQWRSAHQSWLSLRGGYLREAGL